MLIRKNTKAFKTILEIVTALRDRPDREKLIRLYITKAGDTVDERISTDSIQGNAGLFYEMNYQAILGNLRSPSHQLHASETAPGIYFFHSTSNKAWDETPFEFDEDIRKEFSSLPDLPAVRKKEKAGKFVLSPLKTTEKPAKTKGEAKPEKGGKGPARKEKKETEKAGRVVALWPKQPEYDLKHDIHFTGLERITFRQGQLTKRDVLDYYNSIADNLLPWLKDRPLVIRLQRDGHQGPPAGTLESLMQNSTEEIPEWVRTTARNGKGREGLLLCNDREHLLFYVQLGCLEFHAGHARVRALDAPDYIVIAIESHDDDPAKAIEVALAAKQILDGLKLPSFPKTDGTSGLHLYIPLDAKSDFETCKHVAEYLCKLVRLKVPERVVLEGSGDREYGKVLLRYLVNDRDQGVIVPYSLAFPTANVATPLSWEEVQEDLAFDTFDRQGIFKRLKKQGDPFEKLYNKKVNAGALEERLVEFYSFLV